eukprot:PRCOL_00000793-RA
MSSARELKERGNAHYMRKQYAQATEWYTRAIEADPSVASIYTNRAAALYAAGKYSEAADDAKTSVGIDEKWVKGWYRLGLCLEKLERLPAAVEAFELGLKADPTNAQLREGLERTSAAAEALPKTAADAKAMGNAAYKVGQYEEASKWYTYAMDLLKSCDAADAAIKATLLTNRAEAYRQQALHDLVVVDCTAALELDPESVKAYMRRGLARETLGEIAGARDDFKAAVERAPGTALASQGLRRVSQMLAAEHRD